MKGTAYSFAKEVDRQIEELARSDYLRRKGRGKLLREELLPISRLALHLKQPGLEIEVEAFEDNSVADGHIRVFGFREEHFDVQVTSGYDYYESLRDELLVAEGTSWGAGEIWRDKTSRKVIANPSAVDNDEYFKRVAEAVLYLFKKKAAMPYPPNTVLIISFSEVKLYGHFAWNEMLSLVNKNGSLSDSTFRSIYLFNEATNDCIKVA